MAEPLLDSNKPCVICFLLAAHIEAPTTPTGPSGSIEMGSRPSFVGPGQSPPWRGIVSEGASPHGNDMEGRSLPQVVVGEGFSNISEF